MMLCIQLFSSPQQKLSRSDESFKVDCMQVFLKLWANVQSNQEGTGEGQAQHAEDAQSEAVQKRAPQP